MNLDVRSSIQSSPVIKYPIYILLVRANKHKLVRRPLLTAKFCWWFVLVIWHPCFKT